VLARWIRALWLLLCTGMHKNNRKARINRNNRPVCRFPASRSATRPRQAVFHHYEVLLANPN